jgi:hypothetical protein
MARETGPVEQAALGSASREKTPAHRRGFLTFTWSLATVTGCYRWHSGRLSSGTRSSFLSKSSNARSRTIGKQRRGDRRNTSITQFVINPMYSRARIRYLLLFQHFAADEVSRIPLAT